VRERAGGGGNSRVKTGKRGGGGVKFNREREKGTHHNVVACVRLSVSEIVKIGICELMDKGERKNGERKHKYKGKRNKKGEGKKEEKEK
jgi:hypothetical protein